MTEEERIQHNMKHLGLTRRQLEIHDFFMNSKINTFPPSLLHFLEKVGNKYGMCGDVMAESIAAWIRDAEAEILNPGGE